MLMLVHQEQVIMQSKLLVALSLSMPLDLMGMALGMQGKCAMHESSHGKIPSFRPHG